MMDRVESEHLWHQLDTSEVLQILDSPAEGLSEEEARRRQQQYGPNTLIDAQRRTPGQILWEQIREPMVMLLIIAAGVSVFIDEYLDAGAIGVIVVLNAVLGFIQEYRAERAMAALNELAAPQVKVRRDRQVHSVPAGELTLGDIVVLEAGDRMPADCRVLAAHHLKVQEAALTGESEAVSKHPEAIADAEAALGDRQSMVYMGTDVSAGRGEAVVTTIGMATELGKIAEMMQRVPPKRTPLQKRLATLGIWLAAAALVIVCVVFVAGLLRGEDWKLMLLTALSMAVAAVPEGLPAVATIALALGAKRMLRRNALIRRLPAVETLGSVTVICSDKTGTLTENRMRLSALQQGQEVVDVQEYLAGGDRATGAPQQVPEAQPHVAVMLLTGALCNDAQLTMPDGDQSVDRFDAQGDPTETAFVTAAARYGLVKPKLESRFPRVGEIPFDSDRKRMTTVHDASGLESGDDDALAQALAATRRDADSKRIAFLKGAADTVLTICDSVYTNGVIERLDDARHLAISTANDEMASGGKRVLGLAFRWIDGEVDANSDSIEQKFTFVGLAGLIDPPRPEAKSAVERCRTAGIRPVMITGDHPLTAKRIAADIGISAKGNAVTGAELERHSDADLEKLVRETSVYARVTPEHKLRIVEALQRNGEVVAMTGDGVNDAPALKTADIGVAMGITGTDVSKDASETVLLDDNFATIVNSVEEGRTIYDNIRKFLKYTMTSNTGEIWVMLLAPFAGLPLPLVPLQILWINLVTDGLPGLAMAVEPSERDAMQRPPRDPNEPIFDRTIIRQIFMVGLVMGLVPLGAGFWFARQGESIDYWRTVVFTVLTLSQMGNALAIRSSRDSLFKIGLLSNKALLGAVGLTFALQMAVIYLPPCQEVFHTVELSLRDLFTCVLLSTIVFWVVEIEKLWRRNNQAN